MNIKEKLDLKLKTYPVPTRRNKRCIVNKFFSQIGVKSEDQYDEYDVLKFMEWAKDHYEESSLTQMKAVLCWFYKTILNQDIKDKIYQQKEEEVNKKQAPSISYDDTVKIIQAARKMDILPKALVAMATTYGCRRKEMCDIVHDYIDLEHQRIFIPSAKGGTQRWTHIPNAIFPILIQYKISYLANRNPPKLPTANTWFWKIVNEAGLELDTDQRIGWHALRYRCIFALTELGFTDYQIMTFFRWKQTAQFGILYRYRSMAGDDETIEKVDKPILERHPFLKYWSRELVENDSQEEQEKELVENAS